MERYLYLSIALAKLGSLEEKSVLLLKQKGFNPNQGRDDIGRFGSGGGSGGGGSKPPSAGSGDGAAGDPQGTAASAAKTAKEEAEKAEMAVGDIENALEMLQDPGRSEAAEKDLGKAKQHAETAKTAADAAAKHAADAKTAKTPEEAAQAAKLAAEEMDKAGKAAEAAYTLAVRSSDLMAEDEDEFEEEYDNDLGDEDD